MQLNDKLYGSFSVDEPIIIELLESSALGRLAGISQHGYNQPYWPGLDFSRLEHSIGVFLLLRRYGAPLEEQIAGLIHDVSHAVFSHCIDYVTGRDSGGRQDYQDQILNSYVMKSDIPAITKRHGFDLNYILDDSHFPLKESPLPDICADRLDYSLRLALLSGKLDSQSLATLLDSLIVKEDRWIFKDMEAAKQYAQIFLQLNQTYYAGFFGALMHKTVSDYLNYALAKNYLSEADLYTTEATVLQKLEQLHNTDSQLKLLSARMNGQGDYKNDEQDYETRLELKSRVVDPLFLSDKHEIKRLSESFPAWKEVVEKEMPVKTYYLKFLN